LAREGLAHEDQGVIQTSLLGLATSDRVVRGGGSGALADVAAATKDPIGAATTANDSGTAAAGAADEVTEVAPVKVTIHSTPKVNSHPDEKVNSHPADILDFVALSQKVNSHLSGRKWKKSRIRKGWLIARIKGYDIVESEYGISYLFVIRRKSPKQTSADFALYEHAGFFTWQALESAGRFVKEKKDNATKRIPGHGAGAS
jgi:hypothetical protein